MEVDMKTLGEGLECSFRELGLSEYLVKDPTGHVLVMDTDRSVYFAFRARVCPPMTNVTDAVIKEAQNLYDAVMESDAVQKAIREQRERAEKAEAEVKKLERYALYYRMSFVMTHGCPMESKGIRP